ncbi:MAG: hypothetical protein AAGF11_01115 [Myxococcota bacterium]
MTTGDDAGEVGSRGVTGDGSGSVGPASGTDAGFGESDGVDGVDGPSSTGFSSSGEGGVLDASGDTDLTEGPALDTGGGGEGTGAGSSTETGVLDCAALYGGLPGFQLCMADEPNTCVFYSWLDDFDSCSSLCASGGGQCTSATDELNDGCLASAETFACNSQFHADLICTCQMD